METLLIYIVKVNIALAVFYLLYMLLFRKDTFIRLRRYYFLSAIIFSLTYPIFTVASLENMIDLNPTATATETSVYIGEVSMGEPIVDVVEEAATPIDWSVVARNILLVGIAFLSLRFLWQLISIVRIKSHSEKRRLLGYFFYHLKDKINPFSFFNWIFIHAETHSEKELKQILLHEHTHVRQWHTFDILLVEMLRIVFWWNPIVWLMKRDMAINLEYLADQAVLQEGVETTEYQYHLLQLTYHDTAVQIVNNFNVTQLKQRIIMMNTIKSPMRKLAKYLSVLPLALLLITANSLYAQTNDLQQEPEKKENKIDETLREKSKYHEVTENLVKLEAIFKSELKYPQIAKENGIEGDVLVSFIVEEDGSISNPKIMRGTDPSFYAESIRVISSMPKLTQFTYIVDDEPLRIKYSGHFAFRLDGKKTSLVVRIGGYTVLSIADRTGDDKPLFIVDGVKMGKAFDINSLNDSDIEQKIIYQKEAAIATYGDEGKNGAVLITTKDISQKEQDQPSYKRNLIAMTEFIKTEMKYPKIAKENGIKGQVIAGFTIEKDGTVTNPKIIEGVDPSLDKEAIRIINAMPKWEPFIQDGKPSKTEYTLPFNFNLDGKEKSNEYSTIGFKVVSAERNKENENEVVVRGYDSMNKDSRETLQKKLGNGDPLYIIDDVKMVKGFRLNSIIPTKIESISILKDKSALELYGDEGKDGVIIVTLKDKTKAPTTTSKIEDSERKSERDDVFIVVEKQPEFPGGMPALMKYLAENIIYPLEAMRNGIEGRVITSFIVNKDGSVSDIEIKRSADPLLNAEAIRVIEKMPKWEPGRQKGEVVNVRFTMPVVFRLNKKKTDDDEALNKLNRSVPNLIKDNSRSNKPLIIVDGEKMPKEFDLEKIKPEDIESTSVLKAEEAVSKYADEGKNGVIIITLKKTAKFIPITPTTTFLR